jgi:hypothetical protein
VYPSSSMRLSFSFVRSLTRGSFSPTPPMLVFLPSMLVSGVLSYFVFCFVLVLTNVKFNTSEFHLLSKCLLFTIVLPCYPPVPSAIHLMFCICKDAGKCWVSLIYHLPSTYTAFFNVTKSISRIRKLCMVQLLKVSSLLCYSLFSPLFVSIPTQFLSVS